MEIVPYGDRPIRVGDVAFFLPPRSGCPIVHRIVRVTPLGISTLGDNNPREDPYLLQPHDIKGQVMASWRGQLCRRIHGGLRGRLTSRWLRLLRTLDRGISPLLHPLYRRLSCGGLIAGLLPAPFRPRVVIFKTKGPDRVCLLLGKRIIGRYDDRRREWWIERPFRLIVDQGLLQRQQGND